MAASTACWNQISEIFQQKTRHSVNWKIFCLVHSCPQEFSAKNLRVRCIIWCNTNCSRLPAQLDLFANKAVPSERWSDECQTNVTRSPILWRAHEPQWWESSRVHNLTVVPDVAEFAWRFLCVLLVCCNSFFRDRVHNTHSATSTALHAWNCVI